MSRVVLPEILVRVAKLPSGQFECDGATIGEVITNLCEELPSLRDHFFYESGELKNHILFSLDGEASHAEQTVETGSTIECMIATSGGIDIQPVELSNDEIRRYARHITLPGIGRPGQGRLKASRVLIIGTGGLGSPVSLYLGAAGVGTIGLMDFDVVEVSNLQRQIVHGHSTIGNLKVNSAKARLLDINAHIQVNTHPEPLNADNAIEIIQEYDLVIDALDNFATRYLVNDACVMLGKPLVSGSIYQFDGQVSVYNHNGGPCYRCLFPESPPAELAPDCSAGGVIGVLPGVVGMVQATEAIKALTGLGEPLSGRLLRYNALKMTFSEVKFKKRANCAVCSDAPTITELTVQQQICADVTTEPSLDDDTFIQPTDLKAIIETNNPRDYTLLDVREPGELEICKLPGALNIPLGDIQARLGELNKETTHYVICYAGKRAVKAALTLLDHDFKDIYVLENGMKGWVKQINPDMPIY